MMEIEGESSKTILQPKVPKWAKSLVQNSQPDNCRELTRSPHTYHALMTLYEVEQQFFEEAS